MDQILGRTVSTDPPQVTGLSANVTFVPTKIGTQLGEQVVPACTSKDLNPCKVGYLYDIKASSLDTAIFGAFGAAIKGSPVQVVTNGQSFFTPTLGESAVQTMLQAQPGLNLVTGSDQGIEGATVALRPRTRPARFSSSVTARATPRSPASLPVRGSPTSPRRRPARGGSPSRRWWRRSRPARSAAPSTRGRLPERRHCHQGDGQSVHG